MAGEKAQTKKNQLRPQAGIIIGRTRHPALCLRGQAFAGYRGQSYAASA